MSMSSKIIKVYVIKFIVLKICIYSSRTISEYLKKKKPYKSLQHLLGIYSDVICSLKPINPGLMFTLLVKKACFLHI